LERKDAKANMDKWKEFCQASVLEGGRAAHKFSKGPQGPAQDIVIDHLPVNGTKAMGSLMEEWGEYWLDPARMGDLEDAQYFQLEDSAFEDITLSELDGTLAKYSTWCGLGFDGTHPKNIIQLPQSFRARYIDLLHKWERAPKRTPLLTTLVLFSQKPTGGLRPIGSTVGLLRVWSRIRQKESKV